MYYLAAAVISVLILFYFEKNNRQRIDKKRNKGIWFIAASLPLFLISALRWNVGTDTWHTYTPEYLAMKSESVPLNSEEEQIMYECYQIDMQMEHGYTLEQTEKLTIPQAYEYFRVTSDHTASGFQLLEKVLISARLDVQWLYAATSAITILFVFLSIYLQSNNPAQACLLYVITGNFFLSLNIVSQYMAVSICLFACAFAEKRKLFPFIAFVLLAACFHTSALVFLPVYILPKLNVKPVHCGAAILIFLACAPLVFPILVRIVEAAAPQYTRYFDWESDYEWIFFGLGLAVFILSSYYYEAGKEKPYYRLWYYSNIVGMIALCFSGNMPLMKRINYYFAASHFLLLPLAVSCEKDRKRRMILLSVIICLFIAETVVSVIMLGKNQVWPYRFYFESDRIRSTDLIQYTLLQ